MRPWAKKGLEKHFHVLKGSMNHEIEVLKESKMAKMVLFENFLQTFENLLQKLMNL